DVEIAGCAIEREAPGVPQTVGPYFGRSVPVFDERIGGRNPVRLTALRTVHVDPQQFAQQRSLGLGVVVGVPPAAPVPGAYIKVAVRSEDELAPVVVAVFAMGDEQQASFAAGVRDVRVGGRGGELSDDQITGCFGVVHEETAVRCVVRVKS